MDKQYKMIKYRVNTANGYIETLNYEDAIDIRRVHGVGEIEKLPIEPPQWNADVFKTQLSDAFDLKFATYWRVKGYTDIFDLLSHAANAESVYHTEAISLIQWSHDEWEAAVADIDETSNIEDIINSLTPYQ